MPFGQVPGGFLFCLPLGKVVKDDRNEGTEIDKGGI